MAILLEELLPRLFPGVVQWVDFACLPHEGKDDLVKSLERKLRQMRIPGCQFVLLHDQDSADCHVLKADLVQRCATAGRPDTVVRIVCHELEAWYFGEPEALAAAYDDPKLARLGQKKRYRVPDRIVRPAQALAGEVPDYEKLDGARRLGQQLSREGNRSASFQVLLTALDRLLRPGE